MGPRRNCYFKLVLTEVRHFNSLRDANYAKLNNSIFIDSGYKANAISVTLSHSIMTACIFQIFNCNQRHSLKYFSWVATKFLTANNLFSQNERHFKCSILKYSERKEVPTLCLIMKFRCVQCSYAL